VKNFNFLHLLVFIIASELIGSLGSIFTIKSIPGWYSTLVKSPLTPPNWVFAPVWIILFLLMGISGYLIWQLGWNKKKVRSALYFFIAQFTFNVLWSFLFFGLKSPFGAFLEIIILWFFILLTLREFIKVRPIAGWLFLPYFLWVTFASYLNFSVAFLNR